jgi:putative ABC transport system substrate-binding protein
MRRRDILTLLGSAAVVWPHRAPAQQASMPVIGFLSAGSADRFQRLLAAFRQGLVEKGYVEGQNVAIEFRWADGHYERLAAMATDLVGRRVAVIFSGGGAPSAFAAKAATATIPIVFSGGSDPVKSGLVASLSRPGGNLTGVAFLTAELAAKQLEMLRLLVPRVELIGLMVDPANGANAAQNLKSAQEAAARYGQRIQVVNAATQGEIDAAFLALRDAGAGALLVTGEPFYNVERDRLVRLAAEHAIPAIYSEREFAAAGGLASYGASLADVYRQAGVYVGRVLGGAKPADLPVVQPTTFELVLNLKTASALGITVPQALLVGADEVIE